MLPRVWNESKVWHEGNANESPEEAAEVVRLVQRLMSCTWTDRSLTERRITAEDVLVVTPFNAQVREIDGALSDAGLSAVRVGTVDKFQGRESPVVLYSMASSSASDAPRGLEFLFDLHRLNVRDLPRPWHCNDRGEPGVVAGLLPNSPADDFSERSLSSLGVLTDVGAVPFRQSVRKCAIVTPIDLQVRTTGVSPLDAILNARRVGAGMSGGQVFLVSGMP